MRPGSTAVGSSERITRSASWPGVIEPLMPSWWLAYAEPLVYARRASAGVMASPGLNGAPEAVRRLTMS